MNLVICGLDEIRSFHGKVTHLFSLVDPEDVTLTTDVSSLFGDLLRLGEDTKLKVADRREDARRLTWTVMSTLMAALGFLSMLFSCSATLNDPKNGLTTPNGISTEGWIMIGSLLSLALGVIGISSRPKSLLPSRRALRARVAKTIKTWAQTRIQAEDLRLGTVETLPG